MTIAPSDAIFIAKSELGLWDGTRYGARPGEAWCAYFLHWCAVRAGAKEDVIPCLPWCDDLRDYYRAQGRWRLKEEREPKIGDIICFGWDGKTDHVHHVGFVAGVDKEYVYTIEGNSGARRAVCEWKYPLTSPYILGYCRPKYTSAGKSEQTPIVRTDVDLGTIQVAPTVAEYRSGKLVSVSPKANELTLVIQTGDRTFLPRVLAGVRLTLQSRGAAGCLTFEVLPGGEAFYEGSKVLALMGEDLVFMGYVFTKSRDMDGVIRVTAYDQLRYFKNKEYRKTRGRASEVLRNICSEHGLTVGKIEETPVVLSEFTEDNATLFDIMEHALSETELGCGVRYVMGDKGGGITLRAPWECGVKITSDCVRSLSYTSSIEQMLNRIKAITDTETERQITVLEDRHSIGRYGLLQDVEKQSERDINAAKALLKQKNKVSRRLKLVTDGDIRVRAGCLLDVDLMLGDMALAGLLTVASVTHVWDGNDHTMELVLEGGDFDA